jgi:hypothetical protein
MNSLFDQIAVASEVCQIVTLPGFTQFHRGSEPCGLPTHSAGVSGTFYVPVYSSVSMSQGKLRAEFSVTLSIHNASETQLLVLRRIAGGKLVESFLRAPVALKPFSTVEVFVPVTDVRGGTGANFVVDWAATGEIAEPVVEALMFGGLGSGHYAFISQGRPLKVVGKN